MKELILFSFVVLFISCQNPPLSKFEVATNVSERIQTLAPLAATEVLSCELSDFDSLDLVKELENREQPGIYYREVVLRSEIPAAAKESELICISEVSSTTEDKDQSPSLTLPMAQLNSDDDPDQQAWRALSEHWDIQKKLSCGTQNLQNLNPVCQNRKMLALQ